MLRLGLCDDDTKFLESLKELTYSISASIGNGLEVEIKCFSDGQYLIDNLSSGNRYDLIMLDWDMPGMNGEETGKAIRALDSDCLIIFVTAFSNYAIKASKLTMFRYITKDRLTNELPEALLAAYDKQLFNKKTIQIKETNKSTHLIRIREIIYIENREAKTTVYLKTNGKLITSRFFLSDNFDFFLENGFVKSFKGIMINSREILELSRDQVIMSDKSKIPISRQYKQGVVSRLQRLMETEI